MATKNDVTGDSLVTNPSTQAYRDNWDAIFSKPKVAEEQDTQEKEEKDDE